MNRLLPLLAILLAAFTMNAQSEVYTVNVGQFSKLRITDNVNVVYRFNPDSTGMAQYRGAKEFADAFILTPKTGKLRIQVSTEDVGKPDLPTLYVYSDFLTEVESTSALTVNVESCAPCAEMKLTLTGNGTLSAENVKANVVKAFLRTGNGTINISGRARDAVYRMLGTGIIQADRLEAEKVQCKILGTGTIGCWALQNLNVSGIGSTKIYFKGEPLVKKTGGGKVYSLPDDRPMSTVLVEGDELVEKKVTAPAGQEEEEEDDDTPLEDDDPTVVEE